jgi:hypothetical protein
VFIAIAFRTPPSAVTYAPFVAWRVLRHSGEDAHPGVGGIADVFGAFLIVVTVDLHAYIDTIIDGIPAPSPDHGAESAA